MHSSPGSSIKLIIWLWVRPFTFLDLGCGKFNVINANHFSLATWISWTELQPPTTFLMSKMCYDPESKPQASSRPSFLSKTWTSGEYMVSWRQPIHIWFPYGHLRYQKRAQACFLAFTKAQSELLLLLLSSPLPILLLTGPKVATSLG